MTDKHPEALRLADELEEPLCDFPDPTTLEAEAAAELRRLHAENQALRAKLNTYEDLGDAGSDVQLLRMGYAAARLEIESLRKEHADELAVAYMCGASREKEIAAQPSYEHQRAIMEGERNASLDAYSRVVSITSAESRIYERAFTSGWDRRDRLASYGQAPAQAAPAAVAGPGGYGPKVTVKRRCSDCKACNSESYAVQGDSGHYVYCEHPSLPERKYIGDTRWDTPGWCPAAAPTAQPAPVVQLTSEQRLAMVVEMDAHDIVLAAIDAEAAAAQPAPQQEAQQQEVQEPVAWQSRTRQTWGGDTTPWSPWELCTKGQAEDYWKMPLLHDWAYEARALYTAPQPAPATQQAGVALSDDLHPKTSDLVQRFAAALAEKLSAAEKKYGYSDGWASPNWMDECRQHLSAHIAKGDPRDVAAYCAFLWHHGATTASPQAEQQAPTGSEIYVCARKCYNCGHAGINDDHADNAACKSCDWSGPSPEKDHCPDCEKDGTMTAACPMCSCAYIMVADAQVAAPAALNAPQAAESVPAPVPPPECETEAEKRAFAFGWFKALESERMKAESVQEDAARYRWLAGHCRSTSEHWGGRWSIVVEGPAPKSHDSEDDFDAAIDAGRKQGATP